MTDKYTIEYFRSKGLLPFQVEAAIQFFRSEKKYLQLVSPVGTGKTHLASIIANEIIELTKGRILAVAPASALVQHWKDRMANSISDANTIILDRKTFLELESQVPIGACPFPTNTVFVISIDLANREDMEARLADVPWDLVIFDDSHMLRGKRKEVFTKLMVSDKLTKCLLLTSFSYQPAKDIDTIKVDTKQIVDCST